MFQSKSDRSSRRFLKIKSVCYLKNWQKTLSKKIQILRMTEWRKTLSKIICYFLNLSRLRIETTRFLTFKASKFFIIFITFVSFAKFFQTSCFDSYSDHRTKYSESRAVSCLTIIFSISYDFTFFVYFFISIDFENFMILQYKSVLDARQDLNCVIEITNHIRQ